MLIGHVQQCVPRGHGCCRCFQKGLHCPGLTKAKRTKSSSPLSVEHSLSSTDAAPSVIATPVEVPASVSSELSKPDIILDMQEGHEGHKALAEDFHPERMANFEPDRPESPWNPFCERNLGPPLPRCWWVQEPSSEESDALDEIRGLEIGFNYLDQRSITFKLPMNHRSHLSHKVSTTLTDDLGTDAESINSDELDDWQSLCKLSSLNIGA